MMQAMINESLEREERTRGGVGGGHRDNLKDSRSQETEERRESGCRAQTEGKTAGSKMKEEDEEEVGRLQRVQEKPAQDSPKVIAAQVFTLVATVTELMHWIEAVTLKTSGSILIWL